jgi:predicted permease
MALLIVSFLLGIVMARSGRFPVQTSSVLGGYIIHVPLPALALLHIHKLQVRPELLAPATMPWIVFIAGAAIFLSLYRLNIIDRATAGCLILTAGLGNTSFVGLPMIEAYYGRESLAIGIIADQAGTFLVLSTGGIFLAAKLSQRYDAAAKSILYRILTFPPFIALLAAIMLRPIAYPEWITAVLEKLGNTLTPVALVAVGFQVRLRDLKDHLKDLTIGLSYKLLMAPAIIAALYLPALSDAMVAKVTVFEAAMGPMITGGIVAMEQDLNRPLASLMLAVGIALSFLTLPLWYHFMQ